MKTIRSTFALLVIAVSGLTTNQAEDALPSWNDTLPKKATRNPTSSPGRYAGMDNGWSLSLLDIPLMAFNKSIFKYPNIKRFPGGASNDLLPDLQHPENPVPALDVSKATTTARMGGD